MNHKQHHYFHAEYLEEIIWYVGKAVNKAHAYCYYNSVATDGLCIQAYECIYNIQLHQY